MFGFSIRKVALAAMCSLPLVCACKTTADSATSSSAVQDAEATAPAPTPKAYGLFTATVKPKFAGTAEYLFYLFCASQTLPAYNANAVAWGDQHLSFEGDYPSGYVMMLEFPSTDAFQTWYTTEPYLTVKKIRFDATDGLMSILQQGVSSTATLSTVTPKGSEQTKAFAIINNNITDQSGYATYLAQAMTTITSHGGRTVLQGEQHTELEGHPNPDNIEVYEFPSMDALTGWYESPEYQALIPARQAASNIVFLIGQQGIQPLL